MRTPGEWNSGHIEGAKHIPLPQLPKKLMELPKDQPIAVICGSGYRSSLGGSLLEAAGFQRVQNVMGGMGAYSEANCEELQPADLVFSQETK